MRFVNHENCHSSPSGEEVLKEGQTHQQSEFIIPAGFLIGLGMGILLDQVFSCLLIGIGLGCLVSELLPLARKSREEGYPLPGGAVVTNILIGAFLIFTGIGIALAPAIIWPYTIAGFFILLGIGLLLRVFFRPS
jgi:hypothetical protein